MLRKIRALYKHITIEFETLQQALKLINRHRKREQKVCCLHSDSSIQKLSVTQRVLNSRAWCHVRVPLSTVNDLNTTIICILASIMLAQQYM